MSDLPEKLYYDVLVSNLLNKTTVPPQLIFNQTRSTPYLKKPDEYLMSIVRWTLDTQSLPIFRPTIKPDSEDVNETIYSITLEYNGKFFKKFINFEPQNEAIQAPVAPKFQPNQLQDNTNSYYDIYSYSYWIYLVNEAFKSCFEGLAEQTDVSNTFAPVMTFDTALKIAIINADIEAYSLKLDNPIKIYFNTALGNLFSSFPFKIVSSDQTRGMNFQLQPDVFDFTVIDFPPYGDTQFAAIQVFQEYSTVASWNPVAAICVMSNTLGVIQNVEGMPTLFLNDTVINGSGNNSLSSNLITDFVADNFKPNIIYIPSAEYRRIEMVGSTPLSNLDISVFWRDRVGSMIPFRLASGGSCTMKIMFEKKHKY